MPRRAQRLWLLSSLLVAASATQAAGITLVSDRWCPYNCDPGSDKPGYMVEIVQIVFGRAGHQVEYQALPWARAVVAARNGEYDGVIGAARDGSARDFVFPDVPAGMSANAFLVRRGHPWRYTGIDSLPAVRLGVVLNYSYDAELDAYLAQHRGDPSKVLAEPGDGALARNLRKLESGQIEALIENRSVLEYQLAQRGLSDRFEFAGEMPSRGSYIAFSPVKPASAEYARLLGEGIRELRRSGELDRILARYGLRDWER